MLIGLSSNDLSQIDVGVLARWKIQPRLLGVPGVANVAIWGHRDRQLQVLVDPAQMQIKGVTLDQVVRTAGNALWVSPLTYVRASTPGTGGFLDTPNQRIDIQHTQPIKTAQDLAKVPIEGTKADSLHLGDVAQVIEDHQPLIGDAVVGEQPNMLLVVERYPGTSVEDVTRGVEYALDEIRPGLAGLKTDSTIFRPATFVENALDNLSKTLLISLILLVLLLGAFIFDWRGALVSLLTILMSLAAAVGVLAALGVTFNLMILAGLVMATAIVIDDAVIGVDNVRRRLRERHEEGTILAAATEMRAPVFAATVIIAVSVVPVVLIAGVNGSLLKPLAFSYALVILSSMAVALTVAPALAMVLLSKSSLRHRESPIVVRLQRGYGALLARLVNGRRWTHAASGLVLVLAAAGFAALPLLGSHQVTPALKDRNLLIRWDALQGTSLPEMNRISEAASRELRSIPGVRNVGALSGRAVTSDKVSAVDGGELWVTLDPAADYAPTVASVQSVIDGYPGLKHDVRTYQDQRLSTFTSDSTKPIVARVYGNDPAVMRAKADEVAKAMSEVKGVFGAKVNVPATEPVVEVEVFINKAASHGLKPGEVRRAAATLMSGITAGSLYEQQKVFDVVVRGTPSTRANVASLRDLRIDKPDGTQVRLGDVADVRIRPNPVVIAHNEVSRNVEVVADVFGRDLGAVTSDVESRLQKITFPREHHVEVLKDSVNMQSGQQRTLLYAIAAAIAIFFLLQAIFGSWRLAGLLFFVSLAALSGGVLVAVFRQDVLSVTSLLGLLTVLALVVRSGILQIKQYQRLEQHGQTPGSDLVVRGAQERFGPILTTVFSTGLVLTPLVVLGNGAGLEMVGPMASIILGGLLSATLLVLFVLPTLYLGFGSRRSRNELHTSAQSATQRG
jgi:Cu/Ag efflux pump CusA